MLKGTPRQCKQSMLCHPVMAVYMGRKAEQTLLACCEREMHALKSLAKDISAVSKPLQVLCKPQQVIEDQVLCET